VKLIRLDQIFEVKYGVNLELNRLTIAADGVNFVSRTARNNGVSAKVALVPNLKPLEAGLITVAGGGSVAEAFVQPEEFYSGRDLYYLRPIKKLSFEEKLFYCMAVRANKYRFNYGRQANRTLHELMVPAPHEIPKWTGEILKSVVGGWKARLSEL
jgi:Type I restriction modification DNA specificity domain